MDNETSIAKHRPAVRSLEVWLASEGALAALLTRSTGAPLAVAPDTWFTVETAARRLDSARRQFDRARARLASLTPLLIAHPNTTPEAAAVQGDLEMAVTALYRAIVLAEQFRDMVQSTLALPTALEEKKEAIKDLRDAFEHPEERARGRVRETNAKGRLQTIHNPDRAWQIFDFGAMLSRHVLAYGGLTLTLGLALDALLDALDQFIVDLWRDAVQRGQV